ncbi:hypothetical protein ABN239_06805, partial [Providencia vermicola]|uniref:hypothetical protein n=1 Tax=Providencia vermicola TaxID=333965 RepID=UPI0032DBD3A7
GFPHFAALAQLELFRKNLILLFFRHISRCTFVGCIQPHGSHTFVCSPRCLHFAASVQHELFRKNHNLLI